MTVLSPVWFTTLFVLLGSCSGTKTVDRDMIQWRRDTQKITEEAELKAQREDLCRLYAGEPLVKSELTKEERVASWLDRKAHINFDPTATTTLQATEQLLGGRGKATGTPFSNSEGYP